jgi:hypothetical protein
MPAFFLILFKINLVLVLFAAAYYLVLRQLTFYVINRVFLVFGILFSTLYPFIDFTDFFQQHHHPQANFIPDFNQQVVLLVQPVLKNELWQLVSIFFYSGVVIMASRLIIQFISLYKIHQKSTADFIANFKVRVLVEKVSPFSFWQTIYLNPSLHTKEELDVILAHEQVHVTQWHSLDIILAELSIVFYWFNPGIWLMKKAVKENLEFIADEKILQKGIDKKAYQYGLINVGKLAPAASMVNNFSLSDLKKRIKMMNAKRSSNFNLSRYLLVLPLLLIISLAFTVSKKSIAKHFKPVKEALFYAHFLDTVEVKVEKVIASNKVKSTKFIVGSFFNPSDTLVRDLSKSIHPLVDHSIVKVEFQADSLLSFDQKPIGVKIDSATFKNTGKNAGNINVEFVKQELDYNIITKSNPKAKLFLVGSGNNTNHNIKDVIFFDGVKITPSDLIALQPDEIKSICIQVNNSTKEILIFSNTAPAPLKPN